MNTNELPPMNTDTTETKCCPRFQPEGWDNQTIHFDNQPFVKAKTINFLHIPLNMGSMLTRTWKCVRDAQADRTDRYLILSRDPSPWVGEHYIEVAKPVDGLENVALSGTYLTKLFEGPYQNAGKWVQELKDHATNNGKGVLDISFFYTTCPKCAKTFGKNYVVGFVKVA